MRFGIGRAGIITKRSRYWPPSSWLQRPGGEKQWTPAITVRQIREGIAEVAAQPGAAGFFLWDYRAQLDRRVTLLKIAKGVSSPAVPLSDETIADGSYPLALPVTLYVRDDAPPVAVRFSECVAGEAVERTAKDRGLFPEAQRQRYL